MDEGKKLVIITGCDSGMGLGLARRMAGMGFHVLASYVEGTPPAISTGVTLHRMDLRKTGSIESFAAKAIGMLQGGRSLHALVNNAGIAMGGPVENLSPAVFRDVMQVNFFGLVELTRLMIPCLKRDRAMVVIHGSMAGRIALPFLAPYAASKFAIEGFTDSLRRELAPFGVRTVLLETAGVATPIWSKARNMDIGSFNSVYRKSLDLFLERFVDAGNQGLDQEVAARRICGIIMKRNPRPRYIIGKSVILSRLEMMIPATLMDMVLARLFSMDYGRGDQDAGHKN